VIAGPMMGRQIAGSAGCRGSKQSLPSSARSLDVARGDDQPDGVEDTQTASGALGQAPPAEVDVTRLGLVVVTDGRACHVADQIPEVDVRPPRRCRIGVLLRWRSRDRPGIHLDEVGVIDGGRRSERHALDLRWALGDAPRRRRVGFDHL
jgi:hypothetical protein